MPDKESYGRSNAGVELTEEVLRGWLTKPSAATTCRS